MKILGIGQLVINDLVAKYPDLYFKMALSSEYLNVQKPNALEELGCL